MASIGFLHTSPTHIDHFAAVVDDVAPGTEVVAVVDEVLLDRARTHGLADLILIGGVADRIAELVDVDVVICTCSTIGALAETIGEAAGITVCRVDRAMAEHAVAAGERIAVVAAVESTAEPTAALLGHVAAECGSVVEVEVDVVQGAWERFERGDLVGYESLIAAAVERSRADADVIVLAQASMHAVADRPEFADLDVPLLSSPRLAVEAALGAV